MNIKETILLEGYIQKKYSNKPIKEKRVLKNNFIGELKSQEESLSKIGSMLVMIGFSVKKEPELKDLVNYWIEENKDELLKIIENGVV